jgi:hypothetical protein
VKKIPLATLDDLRIPTPCTQNWDEMAGDDRARFCGICQKHVHNLSEYTREEADWLLSGDRLPCLTFIRDTAGRVVTADSGRRRHPWRVVRMLAAVWALALTALGCDKFGQTTGKPAPNTTDGRLTGTPPPNQPDNPGEQPKGDPVPPANDINR